MNTKKQATRLHSDAGPTLLREYGPLLGGDALRRALGFQSPQAFARARRLGILGISVFHIEGRRGYFARTPDVAAWLDEVAQNVPSRHSRPNKDNEEK